MSRAAAAVDPEVVARFPGYRAAIVLADGVANGPTDEAAEGRLREAEAFAAGLPDPVAAHPHLAAWRAAFAAAGIKAKRHPCSAEALARRARGGEGLPRINRLVDLYNAVSVKHLLPVGGEDRDRLVGPDVLRFARGDEPSDVPGGGGAPEPPAPGEPIWADDEGVTCRRWSWRQGERTRLTDATTRALFIVEAIDPIPAAALDAAAADLASSISAWWPGAEVDVLRLP